MPRVVGVDIPNNKRLDISLTYVYGVGRATATQVCKELDLDPGMQARDLTEEQITTLATHLEKVYVIEGRARRTRPREEGDPADAGPRRARPGSAALPLVRGVHAACGGQLVLARRPT